MALVVCCTNVHELKKKPTEIVCLLNYIFQLDAIIPESTSKEEISPLEVKINIAFVHCELISVFLLPIAIVYGLHLSHPCQSTLVGYWILPYCKTSFLEIQEDTTTFVARVMCLSIEIPVFLLNHWMWSFAMHACGFGVCIFLILGVRAIYQFVMRLKLLNLF